MEHIAYGFPIDIRSSVSGSVIFLGIDCFISIYFSEHWLLESYLPAAARFQEQVQQRARLLRQVERRELRRDEVLTRRNHAQLILHELKHNMSEAEQE